ncbi:MAG: TIR domain-containing protein [Bacteroidales bacterium]|nr:TIR domain-containing protein [Bacteroidales bacterium]
MAKIFISYKRQDRKKVFPVVEEIKRKTGIDCWIDLEGIESGDQFQNVIIDAIDNADIVVFMLSKNFIAPYRDEITGKIDPRKQTFPAKEVLYALRHNKRLIPVSIDGTTVYDCKWLDFNCSGLDCIDWGDLVQRNKFLVNLQKWEVKGQSVRIPGNTTDRKNNNNTGNEEKKNDDNRIVVNILLAATLAVFLFNFICPWFLSPIYFKITIPVTAICLFLVVKGNEKLLCVGCFIALLSAAFNIYGICNESSTESDEIDTLAETNIISENANAVNEKTDSVSVVVAPVVTKQQPDSLSKSQPEVSSVASQPGVSTGTSKTERKQEDVSQQTNNTNNKETPKLSKDERFQLASKSNDWKSMRQLADEGYSRAYLPLAKHYIKNASQHDLANKYALKALKAGYSEANDVLNELKELDYD